MKKYLLFMFILIPILSFGQKRAYIDSIYTRSTISSSTWTADRPSGQSWTQGQIGDSLNFLKHGTVTGNTNGDMRGNNSIDFQLSRTADSMVVSGTNGILGGQNNQIDTDNSISWGIGNRIWQDDVTGKTADNSALFGRDGRVLGWDGFGANYGVWVDGFIAAAFNNGSIASGNDSHAEGIFTSTGRYRYNIDAHGTSDPGLGTGVKPYIVVADTHTADLISYINGDVSPYFPTTDSIPPANPYLRWAMHPYMLLKPSYENRVERYKILKVSRLTDSTKIWYNTDDSGEAFAGDLGEVWSSYSPIMYEFGNGQSSRGRYTSAVGYAADVSGDMTRAWADYATATGYRNQNYGAMGWIGGSNNHNSGQQGFVFGNLNNGSGTLNVTFGNSCTNSGVGSFSNGLGNSISSNYATVLGGRAEVDEDYAVVVGGGNFSGGSATGEKQVGLSFINSYTGDGAGWWPLYIKYIEPGKTYSAKTLLVGKQYGGSAGHIGESCAYEFRWGVMRGDSIGFSTVDYTTDQLTTGDSLYTACPVILDGTDLPSPLNDYTLYYVITVNSTTIELATSESNANAGTQIDLTDNGSGTMIISEWHLFHTPATDRYLTGRSFSDSGDGLSTGVRAKIHTTYFRDFKVWLRLDGDANKNIRWVCNTTWVETGGW